MKLYELPNHSLFVLSESPKVPPDAYEGIPNIIYKLRNIDGMYSYVTDAFNNVYHFAAWTEVEPYDSNSL